MWATLLSRVACIAISTNVYGLPYMRVTQQISPINPSSSAQLVTGLGFPLPDNSDLIREARFGFFGRITAGMSGGKEGSKGD